MTETSSPIAKASDATFDEAVLRSPLPVLMEFSAVWCSHCRALEPVLTAIAADYQGRMKVVQIDVDESPDLAEKFDITTLPSLVFVKNGERCGDLPGTLPKSKLLEQIEDFLKD